MRLNLCLLTYCPVNPFFSVLLYVQLKVCLLYELCISSSLGAACVCVWVVSVCLNGLTVCVFSNKVVHYIFIEEHRKHNMGKKWDTCTTLLKISAKGCTPLSLWLQLIPTDWDNINDKHYCLSTNIHKQFTRLLLTSVHASSGQGHEVYITYDCSCVFAWVLKVYYMGNSGK